jgi:hypothetical protein
MSAPRVNRRHPHLIGLFILVLVACLGFQGDCGTTVPVGTNLPPLVFPRANPNPAEQESPISLVALAVDPDQPTQPVTYQWTQVSGQTVAITNATSATATVTPTEIGTYVFMCTVSDGTFVVDSRDLTISVVEKGDGTPQQPTSDPPTIHSASLSADSAWTGTRINMRVNATDPNGDPIWYQWTQLSGPSVTINRPNTPEADFNVPSVQSRTSMSFQIVCGDNHNAQSSRTLGFTAEPDPFITAQHADNLEPPNDFAYPGLSYNYNIQVTNQSGSQALTGTRVEIPIPLDDLQVMGISDNGYLSGDKIIWSGMYIAPNATLYRSYTVRVRDDVQVPKWVSLSAQITVNEFAGVLTSTAITSLQGPP